MGEGSAYGPWTTWQGDKGLLRFVRAAILAPSPHNAQAWRFGVGRSHIDIYADRARNTGAIDPFKREMYEGLGTALENLVLATQASGFALSVTLMPTGPESTHAAHVALSCSAPRRSDLYPQISRRHTNRCPYVEGKEVPRAVRGSAVGPSSASTRCGATTQASAAIGRAAAAQTPSTPRRGYWEITCRAPSSPSLARCGGLGRHHRMRASVAPSRSRANRA